MAVTLNYTSESEFRNWVGSNNVSMMSGKEPLSEVGDKDKIKNALVSAESEIDAILSNQYDVPIDSQYERDVARLKIMVHKLAVVHLVGSNGVTKQFFYQYEQTLQRINDIAFGNSSLVQAPVSNTSKPSSGHTSSSEFDGKDEIFASI